MFYFWEILVTQEESREGFLLRVSAVSFFLFFFCNRTYVLSSERKGQFHPNDMFTQCLSKNMFLTLYFAVVILNFFSV